MKAWVSNLVTASYAAAVSEERGKVALSPKNKEYIK